MNCRHCDTPLSICLVDLGFAPPSNNYLSPEALHGPEVTFPLRVFVCDNCWLVQTEDYTASDELFTKDYAYFSSVSSSWLQHAQRYTDMITQRLSLGEDSMVIEVASNDGYLLKNFVARNIPCLGVEPTQNTADAAREIGVPTLQEFFTAKFGAKLAQEGKSVDLILGNNVYAHVPDINGFTAGIRNVLKPEGTVTLEFPHFLQLIRHGQFDTIYHEHFSYLSLLAVDRIFVANGLKIYDVEQISTHGGSLRIYGCRTEAKMDVSPNVSRLLKEEVDYGLKNPEIYRRFQMRVDQIKNAFLAFLLESKKAGKRVAAYGAAAKGVTLLNYSGVRTDLLAFVCDAAPSKQGRYLPGCHIPIYAPDVLAREKPDFIVILPWNIATEVRNQLQHAAGWGARFVTAIPEISISA